MIQWKDLYINISKFHSLFLYFVSFIKYCASYGLYIVKSNHLKVTVFHISATPSAHLLRVFTFLRILLGNRTTIVNIDILCCYPNNVYGWTCGRYIPYLTSYKKLEAIKSMHQHISSILISIWNNRWLNTRT